MECIQHLRSYSNKDSLNLGIITKLTFFINLIIGYILELQIVVKFQNY